METYGKAIYDLATKLGEKIAESLGVVGADFEDWPCKMRINKYNFTPESVGSLGVQLHTDSGFLIILQDDENVGGLEVMDNNSGSFVSVPPFPGSLLANLGDTAHKENRMEQSSIPVIDLEKISDKFERQKLREACEKWGCFRIINHSIPLTLMAEMKKVVEALLNLPTEIKKNNKDVSACRGYMAPSSVNPFYEALGLYDLGSSQAMQDFCSQLNATPHQRQIMETYGKAIHDLTVKLGEKIAESLGVVGADFEDWSYKMRINKYNFSPESVGSLGVQLHTDSGFLTILQDDENVGGLEVMDNNSGSFVSVPPFPGTFLANLGDTAQVWSNGRFCNVKHRVECKEATTRFSIATFMLGPKKGNIEAPLEVVDNDHPILYQSFTYEDYMKLRLSMKMDAGEALELLRLA